MGGIKEGKEREREREGEGRGKEGGSVKERGR